MIGHVRDIFSVFTLRLSLAVLVICISQLNYGFDNQGYSGIQSLDQFDKQFGKYDEVKEKWYLPPSWLSLFNSLTYIGLFAGTYGACTILTPIPTCRCPSSC